MTVDESKQLKNGASVYWHGDAADAGIVTELTWDGVTIAWNKGRVAKVHCGDMREIELRPDNKAYAQPNKNSNNGPRDRK